VLTAVEQTAAEGITTIQSIKPTNKVPMTRSEVQLPGA
jgi:hypothetical protein